jgi:hypothetical protein
MMISVGCKRKRNLALVVVLLATFAIAQKSPQSSDAKTEAQMRPSVIRIGVPIMGNASSRPVNRKLQRDWLVRAFQPDKKKKNKQLEIQRIDAVALDSDSPEEAAREAGDKNCDYVLYTKVVELREPGDPQRPSQPGSVSIGRDPLAGYPGPTVMHDPVHYAVVEYRLQRLGAPHARLALSVSGQEHADENGTVQQLLFLIVNRVKDELREPGSTTPE